MPQSTFPLGKNWESAPGRFDRSHVRMRNLQRLACHVISPHIVCESNALLRGSTDSDASSRMTGFESLPSRHWQYACVVVPSLAIRIPSGRLRRQSAQCLINERDHLTGYSWRGTYSTISPSRSISRSNSVPNSSCRATESPRSQTSRIRWCFTRRVGRAAVNCSRRWVCGPCLEDEPPRA